MSLIADTPISLIVLCSGFALVLVGLWGMLTQRNMIRMIIGFSLTDTGVHMVMVSFPLKVRFYYISFVKCVLEKYIIKIVKNH